MVELTFKLKLSLLMFCLNLPRATPPSGVKEAVKTVFPRPEAIPDLATSMSKALWVCQVFLTSTPEHLKLDSTLPLMADEATLWSPLTMRSMPSFLFLSSNLTLPKS